MPPAYHEQKPLHTLPMSSQEDGQLHFNMLTVGGRNQPLSPEPQRDSFLASLLVLEQINNLLLQDLKACLVLHQLISQTKEIKCPPADSQGHD